MIIFPTNEDSIPISSNRLKVISIYGTDVMSPSKVNSKPLSSFEAISNNAEIYWLLTLAFNDTLFLISFLPLIFIGGKPSFSS